MRAVLFTQSVYMHAVLFTQSVYTKFCTGCLEVTATASVAARPPRGSFLRDFEPGMILACANTGTILASE